MVLCLVTLTDLQTHRTGLSASAELLVGYNYRRLKSSASHASRENTLLRCGKFGNRVRRLQRASGLLLGQALRCAGRVYL